MFDNVTFSLASAVAGSGTVTVGYPTGRSQGDYHWAPGKHKLAVNGNIYSAPADFTLTFNVNASDITLTNASGAAWPASASCRLQIDRPGEEDRRVDSVADKDRVRQIPSQVALLNLGSPNVADVNGIVESQDLTAAGVFSVDVTAAAAIAAAALVGTLDVPRNIVAAWTTTAVLTVTGTDEYGNVLVESSASGAVMTGKKAFKTVTGISTSANITGLTVGTGDVIGLPVAVGKAGQVLGTLKNGVKVANTEGKVFLQDHMLEAAIDAGTALELVSPVAGRISKVTTIARGTITTGGGITVEINTVAVTGLSVTVADGAAAGEVDSDTPAAETATAVVAAGDRIEVIPAAAFNASADIFVIVEIDTTESAGGGSLVVAVGTEATATTGDVRGTFAPTDACDGDDGYMLMVALTNPTNKGVAQFAG